MQPRPEADNSPQRKMQSQRLHFHPNSLYNDK